MLLFNKISCKVIEHCDDSSRILDFGSVTDEDVKSRSLGNSTLRQILPGRSRVVPDGLFSAGRLRSCPNCGIALYRYSLERLRKKDVDVQFITLHVGIGTFRPVKSETIDAIRCTMNSSPFLRRLQRDWSEPERKREE